MEISERPPSRSLVPCRNVRASTRLWPDVRSARCSLSRYISAAPLTLCPRSVRPSVHPYTRATVKEHGGQTEDGRLMRRDDDMTTNAAEWCGAAARQILFGKPHFSSIPLLCFFPHSLTHTHSKIPVVPKSQKPHQRGSGSVHTPSDCRLRTHGWRKEKSLLNPSRLPGSLYVVRFSRPMRIAATELRNSRYV